MSASILMVPITSWVIGRAFIKSLSCTREMPSRAYEGASTTVKITLRGYLSLLSTAEVTDETPTWVKVSPYTECFEEETNAFVVTYTLTPLKRGICKIGPIKVTVTDPLGLFRLSTKQQVFAELVVLPRPLPIPDSRLWYIGKLGNHQFEGIGRKGRSGTEFHGIREYQPGDELRRIHWRSTARHGELRVIEFEHSRAPDIVIAIDLQSNAEADIGFYTPLDYGAKFAAYLAEQVLALGGSARLLLPRSVYLRLKSDATPTNLHSILDILARLGSDESESLSEVLIENSKSISQASSVVCLSHLVGPTLVKCVRMLQQEGVKLQFIIMVIDGILDSNTDELIRELMSEKVGVSVIECSSHKIFCRLRARNNV